MTEAGRKDLRRVDAQAHLDLPDHVVDERDVLAAARGRRPPRGEWAEYSALSMTTVALSFCYG
jgi:hypothetical protein